MAWLATLHRAMLPHVTYVGVTGSCAKATTTRLISIGLETPEEVATEQDRRPLRGAQYRSRVEYAPLKGERRVLH
jgi:hypothetical protein